MNMENAYEEIDNPEDKAEARDLALLAAQIVAWAGPAATPLAEALVTAWEALDQTAEFIAEQKALAVAPTLDSLDPATLPVPGPDTQVALHGTGFNEGTTINWNGGDEPTEFISETEVRTVVKPSTVEAPLPYTLPVYVWHGGVQSNTIDFIFTAAEEPPVGGKR
jgi:IPT/TIG domain